MNARAGRPQKPANARLMGQAFAGLAALMGAMGACLFVPAGTIRYAEGWALLSVFFVASLAITLYLAQRDPDLLARRVKAGPIAEKTARQKIIQALANVAFLGILIIPALDRRFGWSRVPVVLVVLGGALVALGFLIVFFVFRANSFASAVVEVSAGQQVVDRGPYAQVRHPMYAGALVLLTGMPLLLGSFLGLGMLPPFAVIIVWRLLDEEAFMSKHLPAYEAYCRRTPHRLLPHVW